MKKIKLFFALFAMLALGVGNAWAAEVKWDLTTTSYSSSTDAEVIWSSSYVTATAIKGDGTKVTNYLATNSQTRLYNKNTLSITPVSGYSINSIVITATENGYVIKGTWTNGTSSTNNEIVTITPTDGTKTISCAISATCRLTEIKVLYESTSSGGETPDPDPTPDPGTGGEALSFTWDLSTKTYTTGTNEVTWTTDGLATMHNSGNNATNYLGGDANNRSSSRFYTDNTLSITPAANVTITSVEFTATSTNYANVLKNSTWTNASTSVSGTTVTVTPTNGASAISATISGTCGFTGVTVNYTKTGSGSTEPAV